MSNIDTLIADVEAMKILEDKYRTLRLDAEERLVAAVEAKPEGSVTVRGSRYKATVTFGVNRTIDAAALDAVRAKVPAGLFEQAIEYAPKIKLAGLRYLQNNEPETYAILAQAITAKPAKPSVRVESVEQMREAA